MPDNPYSHQRESVSPRAMEARQKNAFELLQRMAQEKKQPKQEEPQQEFAQEFVPLEEVETNVQRMAFDQEGNFKKPPVEGYWLDMLENITKNDPYHHQKDWRDDAIAKFRKARNELDQLEASIRG